MWSCEKGTGSYLSHPPVLPNCQAGCPRHSVTPRSLIYSLLHVASSGSNLPFLSVLTTCAGTSLEIFSLILVNYTYFTSIEKQQQKSPCCFPRGHRKASQWQAVILHPYPKGGKNSHTCLGLCLYVNARMSPPMSHVYDLDKPQLNSFEFYSS